MLTFYSMRLSILIIFLFSFGVEAVGPKAPDFALYDIQGKRIELHEELSKVEKEDLLVINFTSSTCKPCRLEIPRLLGLHENLNKQGLHVWIVFLGDIQRTIEQLVVELKIPANVRVLKDLLETSYDRYEFDGVPASIVLDTKGNVLHFVQGYNEEKFKALQSLIQKKLHN